MNKLKYLISIALILLPPLSFSQEQSNEDTTKYDLQEVVVTGTRAVEKIIDIPYSVFRVDKAELSYGRKVSAKDVLADVPGLFLQSRYGNRDLSISIRGFGTRSNSGERGVRILQDGIPESDPDGETVLDAINFTSLGGVEVVKSNLSSLYANAPGGVINFISDIDFPSDYVSSTNQVGDYGMRQHGVKAGYKTNDYRLLVSYNYRSIDGFREHSGEYQNLFNAMYEGHVDDRSVIRILGNYVNGEIKIPGALTQSEFDADPFMANPLAVSQDFRRSTRKGKLGITYKTFFGESGDAELEVTGYGNIKELEKADNQFVSLSTRYTLGTLIRFSDKFRLFNRANILSGGMDYANQAGPITNFDNLYGYRGLSVESEYHGSLSNIGFYLLDHLNLVPEKLELFVSGRFDRHVFSSDEFIPYGYKDSSRIFQKIAPKAGINYKLAPSIALYTSYGLSYDIPAFRELINTPLSSNIHYTLNPDLNAQQSHNFELGIKGDIVNPDAELLRKIFFEATFFHYVISDEIIPYVINQQSYFRNAAKTRRLGLEFGLKIKPVEGLEVVSNYTYTNFRYDDYTVEEFSPGGTSIQTYSNNVVPSVPRHILNLIVNYEFELSESFSGILQWDCDYLASMYVDDANSASTPSYFYANPLAGVSFSYHQFHPVAFVGVNNVFDRRYAGYININDYYGRYFEAGEPRSAYAGINISYQF